jgi:tetratricopeptide (TPR) repeat protein
MTYKLENLEHAAKLEAEGSWTELLKFSTSWSADEPHNLFAWQSRGDSLRKLNQPTEAISAFLKGLEVAPQKPRDFFGKPLTAGPLWYRLGQTYSDIGRMNEAIEAFHSAAAADPEVTAIWNDLGVAYTKIDDYKGAFAAFKKAVSLNPSNTNSLKNLGVVYALCGVNEGVKQIHEMLLQLDGIVARDFMTTANRLLSEKK